MSQSLRQHSQSGFTLLEILVVISIIAISMGLIVISINPHDDRRDIVKEAGHFEQLLKLVIDESIFKHQEIGLKVYDDHIEFLKFNARSQIWEKFTADSENSNDYVDYKFPAFLEVRLEMEDVEIFLNPKDELENKISSIKPLKNFEQFEDDEDIKIEPDIYIFSSGEVTAFDLEFRFKDIDDYVYVISANDIGVVSCKALHTDDELCHF